MYDIRRVHIVSVLRYTVHQRYFSIKSPWRVKPFSSKIIGDLDIFMSWNENTQCPNETQARVHQQLPEWKREREQRFDNQVKRKNKSL